MCIRISKCMSFIIEKAFGKNVHHSFKGDLNLKNPKLLNAHKANVIF